VSRQQVQSAAKQPHDTGLLIAALLGDKPRRLPSIVLRRHRRRLEGEDCELPAELTVRIRHNVEPDFGIDAGHPISASFAAQAGQRQPDV